MTRFRTVEVWPYAGSPNRPWRDTACEDAFVRTARRVCELYSRALSGLDIDAPLGALRLETDFAQDRQDVLVAVLVDRTEGFEQAHVDLPPGVDALAPDARAQLVLEVIHGACCRLAEARGWPVDRLQQARDHVVENNFRFVWASPWKFSPDRRHQGRAVYDLPDDGCGRAVLQIRDRDGTLIAPSGPGLAFSTIEGFKRSARTLRWRSSDLVEVTPFSGPFGITFDSGPMTLSVTPGAPQAATGDAHEKPTQTDESSPGRPNVTVIGVGNDAPGGAQPRISFGGGGPFTDAPRAYVNAIHQVSMKINSSSLWLQWWADADVPLLEGRFQFDGDKLKVTARRGKHELIVRLDRPLASFAGSTDLVALAINDLRVMMSRAVERMDLPPHPPITGT